LSPLLILPVPTPVFSGTGRWIVYPLPRPNPTLIRSPILDTPPESHFYERVARGLTKEVVSWGREASEKIGEAISSYLNGQQPTASDKRRSPPSLRASPATLGRPVTTLVVHDVPTDTILAQFSLPHPIAFLSLSPSGTLLFCCPPKGDDFFIYSLGQIPDGIHLLATFSRGYTYSSILQVVWRPDDSCFGVISARGTAHLFSLKRRGKDAVRAIGKIKIDGGVKGFMFLPRRLRRRRNDRPARRRSSAARDDIPFPDVLTIANMHERVTSWKVESPQRTTIEVFTSYFNSESTEESLSVPFASPIADYVIPSTHQELSFPSLTTSPIIIAAFTNQRESPVDVTPGAELDCSAATRGIQGIRGIRLFEYTLSSPHYEFGSALPWTRNEIDLGIPRGEVHYMSPDISSTIGSKMMETPPSSEHDSPDLHPDNAKNKRRSKTVKKEDRGGIERDISMSLGTGLDKTRIVAVPPTPPGSYSTPKIQPTEWVVEILDRGKTMVKNVRRRSSSARPEIIRKNDREVCFEEGVEVLSLTDVPPVEALSLDRSDSADSDESHHKGKIRGDGSVVGEWDK
jgi:hypothetical protein